jgi:nicotinamidase-related amidase
VNWGVRKDLLNISPSLQHAHNPRGDEPGIAQPVPGTRSEVIAAGSWGAAVVDEINPGTQDVQITKHRFSAFWDTETDAVLRNLGIKTLFIGGVNMDQCVMTTLEDASFLGYDTILIEDGTATTSPDYCVKAVLYNVKLLFGFVTQSATILKALAAAKP